MKTLTNKVFALAIATGIAATAAFAATDSVSVTFPQDVVVSGVTLASGQYTITETSMSDGELFVFRSGKGAVVAALATKSAEASADQKTEVVLSREGGLLHVDKLFIEGEGAGYQFSDSK
jgi:hypothetical protein